MLSRGVLQSLQSEGKRTEKKLRRRVCESAARTARRSARCSRRLIASESPLLKTTLQPALAQTQRKIEPLSPAPRDAEGLFGLSPVP